MTAPVLLLIDALLIAGPGFWMAVAVYDNWRHPKLNVDAVAMVLRFDQMAEEFPDEFDVVGHRRISEPRHIDLIFQAIRLFESLAAVTLLMAALLLFGAAIGAVPTGLATAFALFGITYFILIWAAFIVGGNYFHYYFCHPWAQSNHFMFMFWGFFVLLVLLI